jgi:hypothetical protein
MGISKPRVKQPLGLNSLWFPFLMLLTLKRAILQYLSVFPFISGLSSFEAGGLMPKTRYGNGHWLMNVRGGLNYGVEQGIMEQGGMSKKTLTNLKRRGKG